MKTNSNYQANNKIYPTKELQLFLIAAKQELIYSVMLEEFNAKLQVLLQNPEYTFLLQRFKTENDSSFHLDEAIRALKSQQKIHINSHNELYLELSEEKQRQLVQAENPQTWIIYQKMAQQYRTIPVCLEEKTKVKK